MLAQQLEPGEAHLLTASFASGSRTQRVESAVRGR